jgi:hypothetical protein
MAQYADMLRRPLAFVRGDGMIRLWNYNCSLFECNRHEAQAAKPFAFFLL